MALPPKSRGTGRHLMAGPAIHQGRVLTNVLVLFTLHLWLQPRACHHGRVRSDMLRRRKVLIGLVLCKAACGQQQQSRERQSANEHCRVHGRLLSADQKSSGKTLSGGRQKAAANWCCSRLSSLPCSLPINYVLSESFAHLAAIGSRQSCRGSARELGAR
jgi:hypothetical protein